MQMNSLNVRESEERFSSLLTTTILPKWKLLTDYSLSLALAPSLLERSSLPLHWDLFLFPEVQLHEKLLALP